MGKVRKKDNSSFGRFFYSFGTVFLFAVVTICAINFTRDGRVFQKPSVTVSADSTADKTAASGQNEKKTTAASKPGAEAPSKTQVKPAAPNTPATGPNAGSGGTGAAQPANPGEEP